MRLTLPKLLASLAAVAAVSAIAIGGTYANFTANPVTISSNAFSTGSLTMARSGSGVLFNLSNAKIGEEVTGSVTITNTGTLPGAYTLNGSSTGTLAGQLNLKLYADNDGVAGSKIYDGTVAAFSSLSLGNFAAVPGSHTYYFHVLLPSTGTDAGDNAYQGLTAGASFNWNATQV